jgi:tetratricopeptide (TPR) repeat protein
VDLHNYKCSRPSWTTSTLYICWEWRLAGWAGRLAVYTLSRASRYNGNVPAAHGNLALALVQQERLEEAVASYERQLALQPDHVDACTNLASVLSRMRLHDQALEGL